MDANASRGGSFDLDETEAEHACPGVTNEGDCEGFRLAQCFLRNETLAWLTASYSGQRAASKLAIMKRSKGLSNAEDLFRMQANSP